jgi:hypothetical protein
MLHLVSHTHSIGLPWKSDRPVTEAAIYTTDERPFALRNSQSKRPQTYALDRTATGIGLACMIGLQA